MCCGSVASPLHSLWSPQSRPGMPGSCLPLRLPLTLSQSTYSASSLLLELSKLSGTSSLVPADFLLKMLFSW